MLGDVWLAEPSFSRDKVNDRDEVSKSALRDYRIWHGKFVHRMGVALAVTWEGVHSYWAKCFFWLNINEVFVWNSWWVPRSRDLLLLAGRLLGPYSIRSTQLLGTPNSFFVKNNRNWNRGLKQSKMYFKSSFRSEFGSTGFFLCLSGGVFRPLNM
jgi:hypothetical protein